MLISTNWTFFSQLKIILIPDREFLPSVADYIKLIIIFIANKTLAGKAIQYNTTLQNIYT
jgi:hypothetical protein